MKESQYPLLHQFFRVKTVTMVRAIEQKSNPLNMAPTITNNGHKLQGVSKLLKNYVSSVTKFLRATLGDDKKKTLRINFVHIISFFSTLTV